MAKQTPRDFHAKLSRILKILKLISENPMTTNEITSAVDCDRRTVYRYLLLLKEAGFDVRANEQHQYSSHITIERKALES